MDLITRNIKSSRVTLNSEMHERFVQCFLRIVLQKKHFLTLLLFVHSCHIYSTVFEQVIIFSDNFLVFLGLGLTLFLLNSFVFKSKPTANNFDSKNKPLPRCFQTTSILLFSISLLAFYHKCRSLIGYATHFLSCDR